MEHFSRRLRGLAGETLGLLRGLASGASGLQKVGDSEAAVRALLAQCSRRTVEAGLGGGRRALSAGCENAFLGAWLTSTHAANSQKQLPR